jgi:hypothetical protein
LQNFLSTWYGRVEKFNCIPDEIFLLLFFAVGLIGGAHFYQASQPVRGHKQQVARMFLK